MRSWAILLFLAVACAPAPAPVPTPQALGGGVVRYYPQSTPAIVGRAYELTLWTHCGLDETLIDFGGVLWEPQVEQRAGGVVAPPALVNDPADRGRITMLGSGQAVYEAETGHVLPLRAVLAPRDLMTCY